MIELLPLNRTDIGRFAKQFQSRIQGLEGDHFAIRLSAYPDLERLARIPLFLSMLLTMAGTSLHMPHGRVDLIESYLKTLFAPQEHKEMKEHQVSAPALRDVAEALAYTRLQAQEIGATERQVLDIAQRIGKTAAAPETILAALQTQGILRKQSPIRLQFPYPIVQEYLAACYLMREHAEQLPHRIDDALQRPWAQVIQFALEMHVNPTPLIRSMLDRPDDAFSTGLRLVARCVLNGAQVKQPLRADIAHRLAAAWTSPSWRLRDQIGRLLVDGFSRPLLPEVRARLSNSSLEHHGAGEIVCHAQDAALTREVLVQRLNRGLSATTYMHSLRPAINQIANEALAMFAQKARDPATSDEAYEGLCNLIGGLDPAQVDESQALALGCDEAQSIVLRLRAFAIAGPVLDPRALPLLHQAIGSEDYRKRFAAQNALQRTSDPAALMLQYLRDDSLNIKAKEEIINCVAKHDRDSANGSALCARFADDDTLPDALRNLLRLYAAGQGDEACFRYLLDRLAQLDTMLANSTISLLGKFPSLEIGLQAAQALQQRIQTQGGAADFAHAAAIAMFYELEMLGPGSGSLHPIPPHPALYRWLELVEAWMDEPCDNAIVAMALAASAVRLGSLRAADRLHQLMLELEDADDPRFDADDKHGHRIRDAIDELQRRRKLLPLAQLAKIARCKRPNVAYAVPRAMAAHASHCALDLMISLHNELRSTIGNSLFEAIEPLAAQLGMQVHRDENRMLSRSEEMHPHASTGWRPAQRPRGSDGSQAK